MSTYHKLYVQIVFSVHNRKKLISPNWKNDLYKYMSKGIKMQGSVPYIINGTADHIHILLSYSPKDCLSNIVREIKKSSVKYIRKNFQTSEPFFWQEGYGVFTYHESMIPKVIKYIENQEIHHEKISSEREEELFKKKFRVK